MIGLTFAALLAFGLVVQIGVATAVVLGLAAFNTGTVLDRLLGELAAFIAYRQSLRAVAETDRRLQPKSVARQEARPPKRSTEAVGPDTEAPIRLADADVVYAVEPSNEPGSPMQESYEDPPTEMPSQRAGMRNHPAVTTHPASAIRAITQP